MAIQTPNFRPTNHQSMIMQLLGRAGQDEGGFDLGQVRQSLGLVNQLGSLFGGGGEDFIPQSFGEGPAQTIDTLAGAQTVRPRGGTTIRGLLGNN